MFGKIEVYDRVNHDIQLAISRLGRELFVMRNEEIGLEQIAKPAVIERACIGN